jgi:hypothetical protein
LYKRVNVNSGDVDHSRRRSDASKNIVQSSGQFGQERTELPLRFALELDAIGIVDQAVADGSGEGGIRETGVPVSDRNLVGDL